MTDRRKSPAWAKLDQIIAVMWEAMPSGSATSVAEAIIKANPNEIKEYAPFWILSGLISRCQIPVKQAPTVHGRPRLSNPNQMKLPGFEHIPTRIYVEPSTATKRGRRVYLLNSNTDQQEISRELTISQNADELTDRDRLLVIMRRYNRHRPGIITKDALALRETRMREALRKREIRAETRRAHSSKE